MKKILYTICASLILPLSALAVTVTEEVTLTLPSTGDSYGLVANSDFTTLTINSDSFVILLAAGEEFRLRSTDKRKLTNDAGISITCNTSESFISYEAPSGGGNVTVTITPSGTCTASGNSGSTVGGGGPLGLVASPPPASQIASVQVPVQTPATVPVVASPVAIAFLTRDLASGSQGEDVLRLQAFLASDPAIYPEGLVTGYYGALTVKAIKRFQAKYGLPQVGRVGSLTRAKLIEIFGRSPAPASAPSSQSSALQLLTKTLRGRMQDAEVSILQEFLSKNKEIYPQGQVSGYFGQLTENAVKRFQTKYGIDPIGVVGPITRTKINELIQSGQNP